MEHYIAQSGGDIDRALNRADNDLYADCGVSSYEELCDWRKMVREDGMLQQWEELKASLLAQCPTIQF